MKKRWYIVSVGCSTLRRHRSYKLRATRPGRAWFIALNDFFAEFPAALERGLTVGGSVALAR